MRSVGWTGASCSHASSRHALRSPSARSPGCDTPRSTAGRSRGPALASGGSFLEYTPPRMLILLTNDDGIMAPGIAAMYWELCELGEVHVVAPETVQSATGHGITISAPLLTSRVSVES